MLIVEALSRADSVYVREISLYTLQGVMQIHHELHALITSLVPLCLARRSARCEWDSRLQNKSIPPKIQSSIIFFVARYLMVLFHPELVKLSALLRACVSLLTIIGRSSLATFVIIVRSHGCFVILRSRYYNPF